VSPTARTRTTIAALRISPRRLRSMLSRGFAHHVRQNYDLAIADYAEAIMLDPKNARTWYNRGLAYAAKRDYDRAIADYTEAIWLDAKEPQAWQSRALAAYAKQDYGRSSAVATPTMPTTTMIAPLVTIPRRSSSIRGIFALNRNRGGAYYVKRDYRRAIADFSEAIRLDPNDASTYMARGNAYNATGEIDRTDADFNQAKRLAVQQRRQ
jgi:tetratricopeptide (TPR) repeat protein